MEDRTDGNDDEGGKNNTNRKRTKDNEMRNMNNDRRQP